MLQKKDSFKVALGVLFGILIASIIGLAFTSMMFHRSSKQSELQVKHTHEVLRAANEISSHCHDIQLESTLLYTNGGKGDTGGYLRSRGDMMMSVHELRLLTKSDSVLQTRIDTLEVLLAQTTALADSALLQPAAIDENLPRRMEQNKMLRDKIKKTIASIISREENSLVGRERASLATDRQFDMAFKLLHGLIIVLLLATFFSIRYNFNKRIRAQQELSRANDLFGKLFYESPIGIAISRSDDGLILDCNKACAELLGFSREELLGKTAASLNVAGPEFDWDKLRKAVDEEGKIQNMETCLNRRTGEQVCISLSAQPVKVGARQCLLMAILDITASKEAENKILEALQAEKQINKIKSDFVTLASHEFRTPLTTVLSSVFLIENYASSENRDKIIKHLARIRSSVNMLTSILDEFLSLNKIDEGMVQPRFEKMNLRQFLEDTFEELKAFAKPGQSIVYQHEGEEEVCSDPFLLGSIAHNLVSNAIKYSPDNSPIVVSSMVNSKIHLSVQDKGIGIPAADQQRLFERFYRASNAGNVQGTGLGLHLLKRYVEMLGGRVEVRSEEGKGSEFSVIFRDGPAATS